MRGVLPANPGEVLDALPTPEGALLVHVISREAADPAEYSALKPQIESALRRRQAEMVFSEFEEYLLREASFQETEPPKPAAEEEGEAGLEGGDETPDPEDEDPEEAAGASAES
jgi:hypothetical protein